MPNPYEQIRSQLLQGISVVEIFFIDPDSKNVLGVFAGSENGQLYVRTGKDAPIADFPLNDIQALKVVQPTVLLDIIRCTQAELLK